MDIAEEQAGFRSGRRTRKSSHVRLVYGQKRS